VKRQKISTFTGNYRTKVALIINNRFGSELQRLCNYITLENKGIMFGEFHTEAEGQIGLIQLRLKAKCLRRNLGGSFGVLILNPIHNSDNT